MKKNSIYISLISLILLVGCSNLRNNNTLNILVPTSSYITYLDDTILKDFKITHPNVIVNITALSDDIPIDYETNPEKYIINNIEKYDLFIGISYSNYNEIVESKKFKDLSEYIPLDKIYNPLIEVLSSNNSIYSIPVGFFNSFLLVNNDLVTKYGISLNDPVNWDHLFQDSVKLKEENIYTIAVNNYNSNYEYILSRLEYPIEGNVYEEIHSKPQINKDKLKYLNDIFWNPIREETMSTDIDLFFEGKALFGFTNLYDLESAKDKMSNMNYTILEAPIFLDSSFKDNSYIIPGDMLAVSKKSSSKFTKEFIQYFIKNYENYYDPGTFGWFSIMENSKQHDFTRENHIPKEVAYPEDKKIINSLAPDYNLEESYQLSIKLYECIEANKENFTEIDNGEHPVNSCIKNQM